LENPGKKAEDLIPIFSRQGCSKEMRIEGPLIKVKILKSLFDQYTSPTLDVGTSGGRRILDISLAQPESNQDSKLLELREVQIMNKDAYAEIGAELFKLFVSNHIIGGFFVTDALRHQVEALTPTNKDSYVHKLGIVSAALMLHSPCMDHVLNLIIKHSCDENIDLNQQQLRLKNFSVKLR
ncbi:MAG: hypothetical protein EZS28_056234, partial [Streblomastix strix]